MAPAALGFDAPIAQQKKDLVNIFRQVTPQDLVKFGLVPELVGRLPVITTLDDLDEAALIRILTEPKNALVKQYQKLFDFDNIQLELTDDALTAVATEQLPERPAHVVCAPLWSNADGQYVHHAFRRKRQENCS